MSTFVAEHNRIYFGHIDATSLAEKIQFGPLKAPKVRFTNFGAGGFQEWKPGVLSGDYNLDLFQDHATGVLGDQLTLTTLRNSWPISTVPNPTGTEVAGDAAQFSRAIVGRYSPLAGANIGAAAKAVVAGKYDTPAIFGVLAHPKAARTADGNGTIIAFTGPTTSQRLYAVLHVFAYSGFTNVVFTIQSDDAVGFASPTTRLTFSTVTGTTSEFASVAGYGATETHHRCVWDVTGSGSVTFAIAIGVL